VNGEGYVDEQSFQGKDVGGVLDLAAHAGVPAVVVAGELLVPVPAPARAVSLVERFGRERALADTVACVREVVVPFLVT
jgi:glycerate kinase